MSASLRGLGVTCCSLRTAAARNARRRGSHARQFGSGQRSQHASRTHRVHRHRRSLVGVYVDDIPRAAQCGAGVFGALIATPGIDRPSQPESCAARYERTGRKTCSTDTCCPRSPPRRFVRRRRLSRTHRPHPAGPVGTNPKRPRRL